MKSVNFKDALTENKTETRKKLSNKLGKIFQKRINFFSSLIFSEKNEDVKIYNGNKLRNIESKEKMKTIEEKIINIKSETK